MNYPPYNPYMNANMNVGYPMQQQMQRQDMQNQQFAQQQMMNQQQMASPALSAASRPVTSREEAIAVSADFSGAPMVFPDITHNCVYIKRWNVTSGAAEFMDYVPAVAMQPPQQSRQPEQPIFASLQDLDDIKNIVDNLKQQVEQLQQSAEKPAGKGGKKNDAE